MKNLPRFLLLFVLSALGAFGSVQSQNSRITYRITALPAVFPVTYPFTRTTNIPDLVVLDGGANNTGHSPSVTLLFNSDYTVSGGGYNSQNQMQSGNVTVNAGGTNSVQVGDYITILRNMPFTQTTTFSTSGFMSPAMIEYALDKLTLETQELKDFYNLTLHVQKNEPFVGLLPISLRSGFLLGFNSSGNIEYSTGGSGGGGTTYTAGAGLILASNEFSVNPSQSLSSLTVTNPIMGSVTGNATTATRLATARAINGVNFDGSAPITVTAAAGTLTGTTLSGGVTSAPGLTTVAAGTLGTMAVQNSNLVSVTGGTINGAAVTGLATPSASTDAATKGYVDSFASGITVRTACLVATTANITLSGTQTIDGVGVIATQRVLVKNQTTTSQNGIYACAAGAWSRTTDADTAGELLVGYTYFVSSGTTQASTSWTITTAPTTLGTDPVLFTQFSGSQTYSAGTGLNLVGNTFSVLAAQPGITSVGTLTSLTTSGALKTTGADTSLLVGAGATSDGVHSAIIKGYVLLDKVGGVGINMEDGGVLKGQFFWNGSQIAMGAYANVDLLFTRNNLTVGTFTANAFTLGSGVSYAHTNNTALRGTKANFNLTVNVKDYGALGDGTTDDTSAINSAIAALVSHGTLYFPAGKYRITSGVTAFDSLSYITITGQGAEIYNDSGSTGANTFVVNTSCTHFDIYGLRFTGTASVRGSGIHIRMGANNSSIHDNYFQGCSDFAVLISANSGGWLTGASFTNNTVEGSLGDGVHVGLAVDVVIANNRFQSTGDDSIGVVADDPAHPPERVSITGNLIYNAGTGGSGCGIRIAEGIDITCNDNSIYTTKEAGIRVTRYLSTTNFNVRINITGNKLYNCGTNGGQQGSIWLQFGDQISVMSNQVIDPVANSGIYFLDCNDLTIKGNFLRKCPSRSISSDNSTTTNVRTSWTQIFITDNDIDWTVANEAIYVIPAGTVTITNLMITGNNAHLVGANWIHYDQITTGRIYNNTNTSSSSVLAGGTVTGVTAGNNN